MNIWIAVLSAIAYLGVLFGIAWYGDRRALAGRSIVNNPYIYALSLAVYCTAWTFYGSVGRAATGGVTFLPVYLGPSLAAPLLFLVLQKIAMISKHQRTTSIADFISARYGKSTSLGVIVALIAVVGIVPYISIQLKAITQSFETIIEAEALPAFFDQSEFYGGTALYVTLVLAVFAILFGARHLDASERHEGMIAAVAFESIVKLVAFLAVGVFVTYGVFDGFGDLFAQAAVAEATRSLFDFDGTMTLANNWMWVTIISMFAVLCLPRQFHVGVVELTNLRHLRRAAWLFPLYLLLINVFVIPIALAGLLTLPPELANGDTYVLNLPLQSSQPALALLVFIGGISASTSMVIVSSIALSIMVSNNLVTPLLIQTSVIRDEEVTNVSTRLLNIRRLSIAFILFLAYWYFELTDNYTIVSIGLISFTAAAQFAPILLGGLYWKEATKTGARLGLLAGFVVWFYTLVVPTFVSNGFIAPGLIEEGWMGQRWLRPTALFGIENMDTVSQAAFWSLFFNVSFYIGGSLLSQQSMIERTQADLFVHIEKYTRRPMDYDVLKRKASVADLRFLLDRFVGSERTQQILANYASRNDIDLAKITEVNADFLNYIETLLTGAIGAASARTLINSIVQEDPISMEEVMQILDETQEIVMYSKALEAKSQELEATTQELKAVNAQLHELDKLKDDFIATITHELRTPITSIKAFAKILQENDLDPEQETQFIHIIVSESERIARLVNQVLDLKKIQSGQVDYDFQPQDLPAVLEAAVRSVQQVADDQNTSIRLLLPKAEVTVLADRDKLMQVLVNLLSNALKFCDRQAGRIDVQLTTSDATATITVTDNGIGIPHDKQALIFDRFTQLGNKKMGKPTGSGLGLFITKAIVEHHDGSIGVRSTPNHGATFWVSLPLKLPPS